jgi:hypothetical protein
MFTLLRKVAYVYQISAKVPHLILAYKTTDLTLLRLMFKWCLISD